MIYNFQCERCGLDHDGSFATGRFCSCSCANKRIYDKRRHIDVYAKIAKTLRNKTTWVTLICPECKQQFERLPGKARRLTCCSRRCAMKLKFRSNTEFCRKGGCKSAEVQALKRRSKNEILFAELCASEFDIITNTRMFEGWDADIIIPSKKTAILWNGAWHYKQISKQSSLLQIQTRDELKLAAILRCSYIPYVIKDMGKFNPLFVHNQFEIFMSQY